MLTIIEDKPKLVLGAEKWQAAPFRFLDNLQVFSDGSSWQDIVLSGNTALTFTNAKANSLNYLKLFGGTVQNGTPTPDTPMDIICNNGAVKAFKALNISTYDTSASYAGIDITFDGTTDRRRWDTLNDGGTGTRHYENGFVSIYMGQNGNTYYVKALVNGVVYGGSVYNTGEQIYSWNYNIAKNIDIYCPTINTDGTTETVEITGKNLYNPATRTDGYYIGADGTIAQGSGTFCYSALIPVKPNTNYMLSGIASQTNSRRLHAYDSNGNWISQISSANTTVGNTYNIAGTTPNNCVYVRISLPMLDTNVQLELGSTATTYEPYTVLDTATAEMLLKVGDYKDVQSVVDGGVTRNIGIKVLDGTEIGWTKLSGVNYVSLPKTAISNMVSGTDTTCLSNNFVQVPHSSISLSAECFSVGASYVNFKKAGDPTVVQFQQFLADQYNAGTPVIIVYPLATPTTETVTPQPMNIQEGTNIVEITQASIDNLELEVSYKATI